MGKRSRSKLFSSKKDMFYQIVWFFVIGAFLGCVMETVLCLIQRGHFESRQGLIYGPFIPVYGIGAVLCLLILPRIKKIRWIYISAFAIGGIFEYVASLFQELVFGTVSWNYGNYFLNLGGRTSLAHCLCWGILGLVFVKTLYPFFKKLLDQIRKRERTILIWILFLFMMVNFTISSMAAIRQRGRVEGKEAGNALEVFLDQHFPDRRMDRIYPNKKVVKR